MIQSHAGDAPDDSPKATRGAGETPSARRKPGPARDPAVAEAILAAADLLMPDYGYGRVTVRDIARQAGVGLGTIYGYYPGKEEIAVALVARGVEAVVGALYASLADSYLHHPGDCLRRVVIARVVVRQEQNRGRRHPVNEGTPELAAALASRRAAWRQDEFDAFRTALEAGHRRAMYDRGVLEPLARTLLWATDGLVAEALRTVPVSPAPERRGGAISSPRDGRSAGADEGTPAERVVSVADLLVSGVEAVCPWTSRVLRPGSG